MGWKIKNVFYSPSVLKKPPSVKKKIEIGQRTSFNNQH